MHNLRHFYYQNKEKIWKVVLIIAFLLGIIYYLNWSVAKESSSTGNVVNTSKNDIYSNDQDKTYISDKSAVSGGTVSEEKVERINNTISKFLQYCKEEKYEEAYNMISSDCKEKKYKTVQEFKEKYVKNKFNINNIYEIEEWIGKTYRVNISEDPLSTGSINNNKKILEYITIVEENSQDKLNINNYVGKKNIGKQVTQDNVKIEILSKETYLDYEIYNLKIENLSSKTIKLDAYESTNTMYLEDTNGNKYEAYSHEIIEDELVILPKRSFEISIKFSNSYSQNTTIRKMVFSNVVLDYDENKDEQVSKELSEIIINL